MSVTTDDDGCMGRAMSAALDRSFDNDPADRLLAGKA